MKIRTRKQDTQPKSDRDRYRARADALWRDRDACRRAGDYDSADVATRQALYWERLAVQAGETRGETRDERFARRLDEIIR